MFYRRYFNKLGAFVVVLDAPAGARVRPSGKSLVFLRASGEVDTSINPLLAAYSMFSVYFAALVGWLGGTMPVRETQLAMLRSGVQMLFSGMAAR